MKYFVKKDSIVREMWGKGDTILFIFAGAAAEFALNKAVDWLYFTGKLPADPLGRLFSTVRYAREIVFSSLEEANSSIDKITAIHKAVEEKRGDVIPDWAYRDVLFMLIGYSISAYELLERKLTDAEKEEAFDVFYRVGERMGLKNLPKTYQEWLPMRDTHLENDLEKSKYTIDLYKQYRKHLGVIRFKLLIETQAMLVPTKVSNLLGLRSTFLIRALLEMYKLSRVFKLDWFLKSILLPEKYKDEIKSLDQV